MTGTGTRPEVAIEVRCELGEGPVWDARIEELLWVDIKLQRVYRHDPASGATSSIAIPQSIGAIVPRGSGGYAVAVRDGFAALDESGALTMLADVEADRPTSRMNDGKCDRRGRFWAGTMAEVHEPGAGSLYRLDADLRAVQVLTDVTTSNGLDWSPDGSTMYYIDTHAYGVDAYDFDEATGEICNRRRLIEIDPKDGLPDGMTVDAEGGLWVALYDGHAVQRYSADGVLEGRFELPVSLVTSCAFAGPDLADLYITTAADRHPDEPLAGAVFHCRPGVAGLPNCPFAG